MSVVALYAVFADADEAERVARTLVDERLAACVNILGPVRSIFRWQDAVQQADEVAAIIKTDAAHADKLIERVGELHSYDVPAIVSWPIAMLPRAYAEWVTQSVG